jgi:hypothetical protein
VLELVSVKNTTIEEMSGLSVMGAMVQASQPGVRKLCVPATKAERGWA